MCRGNSLPPRRAVITVTKQPWFKFYPSDWRADQMLRLCSAAARGLWVECMCLMHEATPYGHLLVNGRPVTDAQLANLTGIPQDQISTLITELDNAGVLSRNGAGVIYSRRMTRDAKRAADGKRYGKQGGNPTLTHKAEVKPTLNPQDNGEGSPRSQNPKLDKKSNTRDLIGSVVGSVKGQRTWSSEEKLTAWKSKVCKEALATMPDDEYVRFVDAWMRDEQWAWAVAKKLNNAMKARSANGQAA